MKKILMIGHYAEGKNELNGQTVKTKTFTDSMKEYYNGYAYKTVDTYNWKKQFIFTFAKIFKLFFQNDIIIIFPGRNGIRFFAPFLYILNYLSNKEIHYVVIGGWLDETIDKNNMMLTYLNKMKAIYVETNGMKINLDSMGLKNTYVLPNFKKITPVNIINEFINDDGLRKFCIFSRVSKSKGVSLAIDAIKELNKDSMVAKLDIYGQIDESYKEEFDTLLEANSHIVTYFGEVPFNESVNYLRNYYMLLFPTYYEGEGFAGTLLDAMYAGLPVVASDWKYNEEIVNHGYNGYIFESENLESFVSQLKKSISSVEEVNQMRLNTAEVIKKYDPIEVLKIITRNFDNS